MKEYNVNNHIICQVMFVYFIPLQSIRCQYHFPEYNPQCFVLFLLFREKLKNFFLQERAMSLRVILSLFLTFQRFETHYSYKNDSYKKNKCMQMISGKI